MFTGTYLLFTLYIKFSYIHVRLTARMYTITDSICLKILSTDCILVAIGNELHYYQQVGDNTIHKHQTTDFYDKIHGIQSIPKSITEFEVILYGGRLVALVQLKDQNFIFITTVKISDWINNLNLYENDPSTFCCLTSHSVALKCSIIWQDSNQANIEISKTLSCPDKSTLYSSLIEGTTWNSSIFFGGTPLGDIFIWKEIDDKAIMLHRLNGHNGVIFSINCNIEHGIITTTSDDRSVKIWKIDSLNESNWTNCSIKPIKSLYGHIARVFRSKVIVENGKPYIISVGEDSNICVWTESGSLLCRKQFNCGTTLWNLDYDSSMKTIFLCGSDGNVREVSLKHIFNGQLFAKEIISIDALRKDEYLSKVKVLANNKIIALTNENRLVYQNEWNNWIVCSFEFYKSCLLEKFDKYVAIAGYQRASVFKYDDSFTLRLIYETTILRNMVRSFTFLTENEYLLCDEMGNCALINRTLAKNITFSLPYSKHTCITVALMDNEFLFIGDRTGNLHLFEIESNEVHHRHQLKEVHGNLGCTVIIPEDSRYITSGHDGTYKVISLDKTCKTMAIELTKKLPISWVDRIICHKTTEKLYAGFNDKHFVFANNECDIIDVIDCGGGHRCWDLIVNENIAQFLFIRNKMLHRVTLMGYVDENEKRFRFQILKWHIKSCNSVQCIELSNGNIIVISGGDDNLLKFSKFQNKTDRSLEYISDMILHISSIKSIFLVQRKQNQWWIISVGGRAQICLTQMTIQEDQIDIKEITCFMLNSSDVQRKRLGKSQMIDFDPETRFMSVTSTEDFHIYTGCSDGYIRHLYFDPNENIIKTISSRMYGKCLLHIHYLNHENNKYLLTMATDGFICFWKIMSNNLIDSEPFHRLQHHNSGVNSYDIIFNQSAFLIATGGDDQSTVLSHFHIAKQSIEVIKTIRLHYHTAQVNGMKFSINDSCLYTTSVDQTIFKIDLKTFIPHKHCMSTIADAKGLHLVQQNKILVYGCGIQFFNSKS